MQKTSFTVAVGGFQGPLSLLLDFIESKKLKINDISLAEVTGEYIRYLEGEAHVPMGETAEFLRVAATLLLIKSRSLLPAMALSEEEEEDIRELTKRLAMYRKIRSAARALKGQWNLAYLYLPNPAKDAIVPVFAPSSDATIAGIHGAVEALIATFPEPQSTPTAKVEKEVKLDDLIARIESRLERALSETFGSMTKGSSRVEAIVSFLALLELFKRGKISVRQTDNFMDIEIQKSDHV